MRFKKTRICISSLSAVVCSLLLGLWYISARQQIDVVTYRGLNWNEQNQVQCYIGATHETFVAELVVGDGITKWLKLPSTSYEAQGFGLLSATNLASFYLPQWCLVMLVAMLMFIPWVRWSRKFSIRAMLVVTTAVSILLGWIVYFARL